MKIILKILLTAVAVLVISSILPNVSVNNFITAIEITLVLSLLKVFIRPIIVFFTIPITIISMGLFLFVINTFLILLADYFITGFMVNGFWTALLFSLLLSASQSVLYRFLKKENSNKNNY